MKKILALLLALTMLFALAACGEDEGITPTDGESTGNTEAPTNGTEPPTEPPTEAPTEGTKNDEDGTLDGFVPTATKFQRSDLLTLLEEFTNGRNPDRKTDYEDGLYPEENGTKKTYLVKEFTEEHEFNLFLHKANEAANQTATSWLTIDRFDYTIGDRSSYTMTMNYKITCATLEEAIDLAQNDGYRIASFYGVDLSAMNFTVTSGKQKKEVQLTDTVLGKVVSGEYTKLAGAVKLPATYDDSCKVEINIAKTASGQYEYSYKLLIQLEK